MSQLFAPGGQRIGVLLVRCLQITDPTFSNTVFACPLRTCARVCVCVCFCWTIRVTGPGQKPEVKLPEELPI